MIAVNILKSKTKWLLLLCFTAATHAAVNTDLIDEKVKLIKPSVLKWRRHIHRYPELSNQEVNTARFIAEHLKTWGISVKSGVAKTGVVGILKGDKPGPVIGLRADMDALPVKEEVNLSFASKQLAQYQGRTVPVMHACGHDAHVAILLGAAKILSELRSELSGTVVFIFQPAEEGLADDEVSGANLMVQEGVLDNPKIDAMFGLHVASNIEVGNIAYKSGAFQASADTLHITIKGKSTHGAMPWLGVDPIVVGAQVILALQTIVSRQQDLATAPAVITIGKLHAGLRENIIPDKLTMGGTIRALDSKMQYDLHKLIRRTVTKIAEANGAEADVKIYPGTLVNFNDPALTRRMLPLLQKAAGRDHVREIPWIMAAEDFSFYSAKIPTLFFDIGGMRTGADPNAAPPHHTSKFYIDENGLDIGVKAFCYLALGNGNLLKKDK